MVLQGLCFVVLLCQWRCPLGSPLAPQHFLSVPPQTKAALEYKPAEDGAFWMEWWVRVPYTKYRTVLYGCTAAEGPALLNGHWYNPHLPGTAPLQKRSELGTHLIVSRQLPLNVQRHASSHLSPPLSHLSMPKLNPSCSFSTRHPTALPAQARLHQPLQHPGVLLPLHRLRPRGDQHPRGAPVLRAVLGLPGGLLQVGVGRWIGVADGCFRWGSTTAWVRLTGGARVGLHSGLRRWMSTASVQGMERWRTWEDGVLQRAPACGSRTHGLRTGCPRTHLPGTQPQAVSTPVTSH